MMNEINEIINNYKETNNIGLQYYYLLAIHENDNKNINVLFLLLEYSMYLGSSIDAKKYINIIKSNIFEDNIYYSYLLNKYDYIFNDNNYLNYIKNKVLLDNINEKDYSMLTNKCIEKYIKSMYPEYIYLLGQKLYFKGLYRHSFYFLDKYIKIGKINLREAYIYLFCISNDDIYLSKLSSLISYYDVNLDILKEKLVNKEYINKEVISLLHDISNELLINTDRKYKSLSLK